MLWMSANSIAHKVGSYKKPSRHTISKILIIAVHRGGEHQGYPLAMSLLGCAGRGENAVVRGQPWVLLEP